LLTWTDAQDAVTYNVYRLTNDGWKLIGANVAGNEFTSKGLTPTYTYTYKVVGVGAAGNELETSSNTVKAKTLPLDSQAAVFAAFSFPMAEFDLTPASPVDLTAASSADTTKWTWSATPFASALESLLEEEFWF